MVKAKFVLRFVLLLGFWLLLSESIDWQHILIGVIATALIMLFWGKPADSEQGFRVHPILNGFALAGVMLMEIWRSAWHVAKIIIQGREVTPQFIWVDTPLESRLARVVLSNCITLTPGTLTISLQDDRILVHVLNPELGQGLEEWRVHNILKRMEGKP